MARRHGLEREPSAGRLARPLHLMQMDKAYSADAARETAFVRPHCAPRITKVHSAAACTVPAQNLSATLNGYDGTVLFHHAAYAASYTARLSNVAGDATSYIWHRPDKTAPGHDEQGTPGAGKGIQERDLLCLQRHNVWTVRYFILHRWAHLSGTQQLCTRLP